MLSMVTSEEALSSPSSDSELSSELACEFSLELSSSSEPDRFISNKATSCKTHHVGNLLQGGSLKGRNKTLGTTNI